MQPGMKKRWPAKPVNAQGKRFPSTGEYKRWLYLQMLERGGAVSNLSYQPRVVLIQAPPKVEYTPDYFYRDETGRDTWEDFKPRPPERYETLIERVCAHFGPGRLLITGPVRSTFTNLREIIPEDDGS